MTALLILSGLLELVGLVCAGIGFRATWHEHAHGERFIEPMLRPVKEWTRATTNRVRLLFGRPAEPRVVHLGAASSIEFAGSARMTVGWGAPPDPTTDLAGYAKVVTERINALHAKVQNQDNKLADEADARQTEIRQTRSALTADIEEVRKLSRQVAVGGLRLQVVGWLFLIAGIVVGTIANAVGS
jgi:hypothetical protein